MRTRTTYPFCILRRKASVRQLRIALLLAAAAALTVVGADLKVGLYTLSAQVPAPAPAGEWPMYNRDLMGTRHSPLTQITPANVVRLRQAWSYKLGRHPDAGGLTGGSEFTPIVVRGAMYVATPTRIVALTPESGREIWAYDVPMGPPSKRGLGYWAATATSPARIY